VPTKIVLKVDFLESDFERDHLAEKSNRTKMGQKIHCAMGKYIIYFVPPTLLPPFVKVQFHQIFCCVFTQQLGLPLPNCQLCTNFQILFMLLLIRSGRRGGGRGMSSTTLWLPSCRAFRTSESENFGL
jgi:hypothetical protein